MAGKKKVVHNYPLKSRLDPARGRPANLNRWPGEREKSHRALLLWAMQIPEDRSFRAVARAVGMSEGAVRKWRVQYAWAQRTETHGHDADQIALDLYRRDYMVEFGELEIPGIAKNIVRPLGSLNLKDPVARAAHEAAQRAAGAIDAVHIEAEQATAQAVAKHKSDERAIAQRHVDLVDNAIALAAAKIKSQDVRITMRDIPVLLECREQLARTVKGTYDETGPNRFEESARVKHAKEVGSSVIDAMHEDCEEILVLLTALKASNSNVNIDTLAAHDAEVKAALLTSA